MQSVTGVFRVRADARRAVESLRFRGVPADKITLLAPGTGMSEADDVPMDSAEQPGIGKAIGAVVGAAGGLSGGSLLMAAVIPGVGPVTFLGLLGAAVVGAAGASVGASIGESLENSSTHGLPEDEIFVYEDALRKGRSVVIALVEDSEKAESLQTLQSEGAESVDVARHEWWVGLRNAEDEHYSASGHDFKNDEKFYRLGFEDALHAKMRCREFDQVSAEMANRVEELQHENPGADLEEPYTRGYQRGREYYQRLCDESKAA